MVKFAIDVDSTLVQPNPVLVALPIQPCRDALFERLNGAMDRNWYTNFGPLHAELEAALMERLACPSIWLMNNGTQALTTALRALDIRGEVITTPFTFPATPHAIEWAGATPVFADVEPRHMTLDPSAIEAAITPRTEAILGVHVYGIPCDVDAIEVIAKKRGLAVIYDAAHAFDTYYKRQPIHAWGDVTMLSFHATKLFHCGEGGALVSRDAKLGAAIKLHRNFGISSETQVDLAGGNGKMNEFQAAIGLSVLPLVAAEYQARATLAQHYRSGLSGLSGVTTFEQRAEASDSLQYFPVLFGSGMLRDAAYENLRLHNIFSRKYFFPLCSAAQHYRLKPSETRYAEAERCSSTVLCLPFHSGVSGRVADSIIEILSRTAAQIDSPAHP